MRSPAPRLGGFLMTAFATVLTLLGACSRSGYFADSGPWDLDLLESADGGDGGLLSGGDVALGGDDDADAAGDDADENSAPADGVVGADGGGDEGDTGLPTLGDFGTATLIAALQDAADDDDPSLTDDLREIYFNRNSDIYCAKRSSASLPWEPAAIVTQLSSGSGETAPEVRGDGLELYFSRSSEIYISVRNDRTADWGPPTLVAELNTGDVETNPTPLRDPLRLFFARGTSQATRDLYEAERASVGGSWDTQVERTELNTPDTDGAPSLALSGRLLVFMSSRPGTGGRDLYEAKRDAAMTAFSDLAELTTLNTAGDEEDPWISEDGRYLVFSRGGDLYEASR